MKVSLFNIGFFVGASLEKPGLFHKSGLRKRSPYKILGLLALFAALPLHALDWTKTEIEQRAEPGEKLAPYVFTFTNSGSAAVAITNTRLSCGCLAANFDDESIKPGASGKLTVHFDRLGLVGEIARTIAITTDEPDHKEPYELTLRADLPEALTLAPRLVFWKKDAPAAAKSIDIKINLPEGLEITAATSNRDDIAATLVTLEAGRHYRLDITPRDTAAPRLAIIALQTKASLPAGTALTVYAQVR